MLTGTSAEGKDSVGALVVLSADTLQKVGEVDVDGSAVAVQASQWGGRVLRTSGLGTSHAWLAAESGLHRVPLGLLRASAVPPPRPLGGP